MPSVGTAYVNVRVNTTGFESSLDKMLARLSTKMEKAGEKLGKDFEKGLKKTDWDGAMSGLPKAVEKASKDAAKHVDRVGDAAVRNATKIDASAAHAADAVNSIGDSAKNSRKELDKLGAAGTRVKNAIGGINLNPAGGGGGGGGFRRATRDVNSFGDSIKSIGPNMLRAAQTFTYLHNMAAFAGTAMAGLIGGLSAVAQGLFAVAANAASAAPALGAAASGMLALIQVASVLKIAMKGVGEAFKLGTKSMDAQDKALAKGADNSKAIAAALRALRNAQDALGDAYRSAARAAEDAARKTLRAEQALAASQQRLLAAQEALNDARKEALEQLEDIGFAAEDAALAEQRAALRLQEAQADLLAVSELAPDNRARIEAELAFKEAELNMRQAKDAREDADRAQQEAAKTGVEGTDAMRDARAEEASATEEVAQNQQDLADARRDEAQQAEDSADRIAEAQQAVADAQERLNEAYRDGGAAASAARTAQDAFAAAMKKLGPEQQKFVRKLLGMRDEMRKFRNSVAEPLFDRLNDALDTFTKGGLLKTFETGLKGTSAALGDVAKEAAKTTAQPAFKGALASAMKQNNEAIGNFGSAGVSLANAFVQIADAAGPVLIRFSEWVEKIADSVSASTTLGNKTDELDAKFKKAGDKVAELGALFKQLWRWLKNAGGAASDAADQFAWTDAKGNDKTGFIPMLTDNLKELNNTFDKDGAIKDFDQTLKNMVAVSGALKTVFQPFIDMGKDPKIAESFEKISKSKAFETLGKNATNALPQLTDIALNILDIIAALSESKSIETMLTVLKKVTDVVADLVKAFAEIKLPEALGGKSLLSIIGYFTGFISALKVIFWAIGRLGGPTIKISQLFKGVWGFVKLIGRGLRALPGGIKKLLGKGTPPIAPPPPPPPPAPTGGKGGKGGGKGGGGGGGGGGKAPTAPMPKAPKGVKKAGAKIGRDFTAGIEVGLREGAVGVNRTAKKIGRDAAKAIAKGAQTASPSKLTIKTGDDIMEGLELGLKEGAVEAELAAKRAGANVAKAVGTGAKGATAGVAAAGAGAASAAGGGIAVAPGAEAKAGKFAGAMGKMSKVMGPFTKLAGPLSKGMGLIGKGFGLMFGPVGMIAMMVIPLILPLLKKLDDKFHIMDKVVAGLSWAFEKLSDAFTWLWDNVLKPIWDWLSENGAKVWENITEALEPVKEGLQTFWDLIQNAFDWIKDHWKLILGILTGPLGLAILAITENWDKIKEIISKAIDFITGLFTGMWDGIMAAWDTVYGWFSTLWEKIIKPVLTDIIDSWKSIFTGVWDGIMTAWDTVMGWLTTLWDNVIKPIIQTYIDGWKLIFSTVWDGIRIAWDAIVGWLTGLWENTIKPIIDKMVKNFKNNIKRVWNGLKEGWTAISGWVSNFWKDKLKPKITYIVDKGKAALKAIWQGIKDGWTSVGTWISGLWANTIKPKIDTLKTNMSNSLKGVWNGLGSGLVKALNWVADKVNWMIGRINSVLDKFGSDGITWTWPHLEWNGFAQGGPVRGRGTGTSDSIPARLSNGEYVIPAKASKKLGPEALEYMRKYGKLPPQGGFGWDTLTAPFKKIGEVIGQGAKIALQWVLSQVDDRLGPASGDNFVTKVLRAGLHWGADKIVGWGSGKDSAASGVTATGTATTGVVSRGPNPLWNWPAASKAPMSRGPGSHGRAWAVDFAVPSGTQLLAVSSGVVKHAGMGTSYNSTYGNYVQILGHPTGQKSLYAHMSHVSVKAGQRVVKGQILGLSGNTGHSTGPHLHFELNPVSGAGNIIDDMRRKRIYIGLAGGGVVSPQGGGIMAMIGEAGKSERVTPLDRDGFTPAERKIIATLEAKLGSGGGGDTYQIHPSEKINEVALADLVARRVAWKRRRGASR